MRIIENGQSVKGVEGSELKISKKMERQPKQAFPLTKDMHISITLCFARHFPPQQIYVHSFNELSVRNLTGSFSVRRGFY